MVPEVYSLTKQSQNPNCQRQKPLLQKKPQRNKGGGGGGGSAVSRVESLSASGLQHHGCNEARRKDINSLNLM